MEHSSAIFPTRVHVGALTLAAIYPTNRGTQRRADQRFAYARIRAAVYARGEDEENRERKGGRAFSPR
jgi:hypothetical protein